MCKVIHHAVLALAVLVSSPCNANDDVTKRTADPKNWTTPSGNYANTRYSRLDQVNVSSIKNLAIAWKSTYCVTKNQRNGPLVIDDIMYVHSGNGDVCALDLQQDAKLLWKNANQRTEGEPLGNVFTYGENKIYLNRTGSSIVAVDALSGKEIWNSSDDGGGVSRVTAMLVVRDNLLVGLSGTDGAPCRVVAYNIKVGKRNWRALVSGRAEDALIDPQKTRVTGDADLASTDGRPLSCSMGSQFAYDPQLNLFYYAVDGAAGITTSKALTAGVGASAPSSTTIYARIPDTGIAMWMSHNRTSDDWRTKEINEISLVDVKTQGTNVRALVHFNRNGDVVTVDRKEGDQLEKQAYREAEEGQSLEARPAAYLYYDAHFYVPTNRRCDGGTTPSFGLGAATGKGPCNPSGSLHTWNAEGAAAGWSKDESSVISSAALATAGGLVFYGSAGEGLVAVKPQDGSTVFSSPGLEFTGDVVTYAVGGKQFIAAYSNSGTGGELVAFSLH